MTHVINGYKAGTEAQRSFIVPDTAEESTRLAIIASDPRRVSPYIRSVPNESWPCVYVNPNDSRVRGHATVLRFLPCLETELQETADRLIEGSCRLDTIHPDLFPTQVHPQARIEYSKEHSAHQFSI